jgi:alpha-aminoadipic semialdehyde synthase
VIGIRHEDKSRWETRAPLVPSDIRELIRHHGMKFHVQTSPTRVFKDAEFTSAGAAVGDALEDCSAILGVKEIPPATFLPERAYLFFSHTTKGQANNMPMLRRLMELKCYLIDYERIVDAQGRRLVFFGRFAGLAGMIDTLWALGRRWQHEGIDNPFTNVQQAYHYKNLEHVRTEIAKIGERIARDGLPEPCTPLVCGFAGYGHVSQGAQEIYDLLPVKEVAPEDIGSIPPSPDVCFKVVFHERHMVERLDSSQPFDLQEYYTKPEGYRGRFSVYVPHLTVLVNGIYWEPKYPRLITYDLLHDLYGREHSPRLRVIGDISCDIEGSVECTVRATEPDDPVFVYEPRTGQFRDGVAGDGPIVLAIDHLPCELPVDSSIYFSRTLSPFIPALANADFKAPLVDSGLPPELTKATVLYQGELTERYRYLERFVR